MPCYSSFPLNGVGKSYDKVRTELSVLSIEDKLQWQPGDWAVGTTHTVSGKDTYNVLKDYVEKVIEDRREDNYEERCN